MADRLNDESTQAPVCVVVKFNTVPSIQLKLDDVVLIVRGELREWKKPSGQLPEEHFGLNLGDRQLACNLPVAGKCKRGNE